MKNYSAGDQRESRRPAVRHLLFLSVCLASLVLFRAVLETLVNLAFHDDRYTFILTIPFISFGLLWLKRGTIFVNARYCAGAGLAIAAGGFALFVISTSSSRFNADYVLSIKVLAAIVIGVGAFVWCYGTQTAGSAIFPLVFLLLMVPIPPSLLDHVVVALQTGSAEVAYRLFKLAGVPVFREGTYKFALPGVTIEVAEECSGIRSGVSLFIASILAGYLFLRLSWSRALLSVLTIPIVIFKNAVRVVMISSLGVYVDPSFLYGRLHRYGGLPFSILALALLLPVLFALTKAERGRKTNAG
jgi:exosortase